MTKPTVREKKRRIWPYFLVPILVLITLAAVAAGVFVATAVAGAPELDKSDIVPDGYRTVVLDDEETLILTLIGEEANRIYVTLDEIPVNLQNAFVAIEDSRFWDHHGIDYRGVMRALWKDVSSRGISEGASTITQQLIKNNVLTGWTNETTFGEKLTRKLQEQHLALELEKTSSKEWILENYLNTINLGGGSWGVETASMRYFGKDVSQLTLSECAVLAAIPQSPSNYDPVRHPEANAERRAIVLQKMLEQGYITNSACKKALEDDVYARIEARNTSADAETFSYFEDAMLRQLLTDIEAELGLPEDEAWDLIYRGGLTIYTTQDTALQRICESAVNDESLYTSDAQASVVLIDNASGQVKAIVGGRGSKSASLTLNRATSSLRQPGSTIKILGEYAAILERGMATLGTVYDDAPYTYTNGTPVQNASGVCGGMTTLRRAIEQSTNIVALKCFQQVGINAVWDSLEKFGFAHLTTEDKVESLALGGTYNGVTNLEMTAAYSAIASGGTYTEPLFYTRVVDHSGRIILEREPETHQAVSKRTAALLTSAMEGVIERGTGTEAAFPGAALAGKSGTTTDSRDVWFVGFSPDFTCGVWGGYDDNSAQAGSAYVKRLWRSVMQQAQMFCSYSDFEGMDQLVSCRICTKCGNLAVTGLCDSTVQGDMTAEEYYVPGTQPKQSCTCHVKAELCTGSNMPAGRFCPSDSLETYVYLKEATPGTEDEPFVCPYDLDGETCSEHTSFFSGWFHSDRDEKDEPANEIPVVTPSPEPEEPGGYEGPSFAPPYEGGGYDPHAPEEPEEEEPKSWWERFWSWW